MDAATVAAYTELVKALAPIIASLVAAVTGWLAWRKSTQAVGAVEDVHRVINGRVDQMLALAREAAEIRGSARGRAALLEDMQRDATDAGKGST